jgi:hypothetical protein
MVEPIVGGCASEEARRATGEAHPPTITLGTDPTGSVTHPPGLNCYPAARSYRGAVGGGGRGEGGRGGAVLWAGGTLYLRRRHMWDRSLRCYCLERLSG